MSESLKKGKETWSRRIKRPEVQVVGSKEKILCLKLVWVPHPISHDPTYRG